MKKIIVKLEARIKYLEDLIVKGDTSKIKKEASRIKGEPVPIDGFDDIRFIVPKIEKDEK
jgi:hypothetical protein